MTTLQENTAIDFEVPPHILVMEDDLSVAKGLEMVVCHSGQPGNWRKFRRLKRGVGMGAPFALVFGVIATETINLNAYEKVVDTPEGIFAGSDIGNATYITYLSDREVVGFQLNASADGMMLDALPGM